MKLKGIFFLSCHQQRGGKASIRTDLYLPIKCSLSELSEPYKVSISSSHSCRQLQQLRPGWGGHGADTGEAFVKL